MTYLKPGTDLTQAQARALFAIVGANPADYKAPFKGITNYDTGEAGKRGEAFMAGEIKGGIVRWNLSYEDAQAVLNATEAPDNGLDSFLDEMSTEAKARKEDWTFNGESIIETPVKAPKAPVKAPVLPPYPEAPDASDTVETTEQELDEMLVLAELKGSRMIMGDLFDGFLSDPTAENLQFLVSAGFDHLRATEQAREMGAKTVEPATLSK